MEKQEHKSKWDELAREIGAEIPPETEQREQAVSTVAASETIEPKRVAPKKEKAPPPVPKKRPAGWDDLAGALGLPPAPHEEPVAEERPAPAKAQERPAFRESLTPAPKPERREQQEESAEGEVRESSRPRREVSEEGGEREARGEREVRGDRGGQRRDTPRQGGERSSRRGGRGRRDDGGGRGRGDSARGREGGGRGREASGRGREESARGRDEQRPRREPRESDDVRSIEVNEVETLDVEIQSTTSSTPTQPDAPTKSPAVSLWHKIFGSPAEQTAKMPEPTQGEPAWNEDIRGESSTTIRDDLYAASGDEELAAGEFDDMETRGERSDAAEGDSSDEERKRGRPRRRRRGGRGRKSGERQGERSAAPLQQEAEGIDDLGVEFADADDDDDDKDESASFEDGMEQPGSELDIEDGDDDSLELGGRGKTAAQRAIPSWDEAIGFIVDSNMQSRSQRRPPPRSDSRGSSRGRPRGGRRKN